MHQQKSGDRCEDRLPEEGDHAYYAKGSSRREGAHRVAPDRSLCAALDELDGRQEAREEEVLKDGNGG